MQVKTKATNPLSANIRSAYTTLIRIAQLEYQLYDSLFRKQANATGGATPSTPTASGGQSIGPGSISAFLSSEMQSMPHDYNEVISTDTTRCCCGTPLLSAIRLRIFFSLFCSLIR